MFKEVSVRLIFFVLVFFFTTVKAQNKLEMLKGFDMIQQSDKTLEEAQKAFDLIKNAPIENRKKIHKANNCENKAQFSTLILEKLGFKPSIAWIFKEGFIEDSYNTAKKVKKSNGFSFDTKIGRKPFVFWGYHVASVVKIGDIIYVFDPWTSSELVTLEKWGLSFFHKQFNTKDRVAYALVVNDSYSYFGTKEFGKLSTEKSAWDKNLDKDKNQMYCGLAGITPNHKCHRRRFRTKIRNKKLEIDSYLAKIE